MNGNATNFDHAYSYDKEEDEEPLLRLAAWVKLGGPTVL